MKTTASDFTTCVECSETLNWHSTLSPIGEFAVSKCCGHTYYYQDKEIWNIPRQPDPVINRRPVRGAALGGVLVFLLFPICLLACLFSKE
jgi:hypothetical protein